MSQKQLESLDPAIQEGRPGGVERRRPRRLDADPSLIPLLRQPDGCADLRDEDEQFEEYDDADRLSAARGIIAASLLAVPFWITLGAIAYALLR